MIDWKTAEPEELNLDWEAGRWTARVGSMVLEVVLCVPAHRSNFQPAVLLPGDLVVHGQPDCPTLDEAKRECECISRAIIDAGRSVTS